MPELILEIAALDYVFPAPHRRCVIAGEGGTIGRDVRNTLVLDDRFAAFRAFMPRSPSSAACQSQQPLGQPRSECWRA